MQFKTILNTNTTDVSPYVGSYNATATVTPITDQSYPIFTSQVNNYANETHYVYNRNYQFNITIANTNGTSGIEFDGVNYSITNISNIFTYTNATLNAGTYSYYYWAYGNGTLNLFNSSQVYGFTVNKSTLLDGLLGLVTRMYPFTSNVNYTENNQGDFDVTYYLFRNGLQVSNPDIGQLAAGVYNYIFNATGGTNYYDNSSIAAGNLTILQNNSYGLNLTTDTGYWNGTLGDWITVTGINCPTQLTCYLFRDDVQKFNPNVNQYFNGTYLWLFNTSGNENYTSMSVQRYLIINNTIVPIVATYIEPTLIDGQNKPYVVMGFGTKFGNSPFIFNGKGIQFNDE